MNAQRTHTYLIIDSNDTVIYVGMTGNLRQRTAQHRARMDVHHVEHATFATKRMAAAVERMMIDKHRATITNDAYELRFSAGPTTARAIANAIVERSGTPEAAVKRHAVEMSGFFLRATP